MIGKQTPPMLLPPATIPIANARLRLKCWPTTVKAGWTPNATVNPNSKPWVRNCCHKLCAFVNERASWDAEQPKAATGYKY